MRHLHLRSQRSKMTGNGISNSSYKICPFVAASHILFPKKREGKKCALYSEHSFPACPSLSRMKGCSCRGEMTRRFYLAIFLHTLFANVQHYRSTTTKQYLDSKTPHSATLQTKESKTLRGVGEQMRDTSRQHISRKQSTPLM